jgi:glycosyltransferase involved in cell wall biosynthesis
MPSSTIAIVAPCFNEGEVAVRFLQELEGVLAALPYAFAVVMVDDGSTDGTAARLGAYAPAAPNVRLHALALPCNLGHQAAIHQGLLFAAGLPADRFIVMDSDGEDDPAALAELLSLQDCAIAFVGRGRRSESIGFRLGYLGYRALFRVVVGRGISFGNYSIIDRRALDAVLLRSFTHYAAFLSRLKLPQRIIVRDRRPRIDGRSRMGWRSLSMHAFGSLVEYSEEVLAFMLRAFVALAVVLLLSVLAIVGIRLFTGLAIPGWASVLSASLFNGMLLCLGFFAIGLLLVNAARRREPLGRIYTVLSRP